MAQLNLALTPGCLTLLRVPAGVSVAEPLRLAFVAASGDVLASPRVLIEIGEGASLTLIETLTSPDGVAHQTNKVVEVIVGKGATFDHVQANLAGDKAQTVTTLAMSIAEVATVNSTSFVTSPALVRHQIFARVHGDDAKIALGASPSSSGSNMSITRSWSSMTRCAARAARRSRPSSTTRRAASSRARSTSSRMRRRPTPHGVERAAARRKSSMHGKPELEITPTTCNAPMVRRWALWTRTSCSISCRARHPPQAGGGAD